MAKVMTNKQYVDTLKHIASIDTVYINRFPYNCGYFNGNTGKFSFDCWNLVKAIINGWQEIRVHKYYVQGFKVTGDIDGATILKKCTTKSKDFTKLNIAGSYLYMKGHAGSYIGETLVNGRYYNVIECTGSWTKNVLYSWVDNDGTRRRYKGGAKNGKWTDWGLMCWVDYKTIPNPSPAPSGYILGKYVYKGVDYGFVFNPEYYRKAQKDVANDKYFGKDDMTLFEHFKKYGMTEGRQAISSFKLETYKKKNLDVVQAYGTKPEDNPKYYEHYCRFGYNEGRKAI